MTIKNDFFTEDIYESDIDLETNEDVLIRIYNDNITAKDKLKISFAFVTDTQAKAELFSEALKIAFPEYSNIVIGEYEDLIEISGDTDHILMTLDEINKWNQIMWDFGYKFDCKLDGWFVGK